MGRGAPISVLVVEDEVPISNLVADVLSASGFVVHEVTTAHAALRYLDSGASIDVLFTDIKLPGRMNGAAGGARSGIAARDADRLRFGAIQALRNRAVGTALAFFGETL
jgi:CheY-like chemotaxis protein